MLYALEEGSIKGFRWSDYILVAGDFSGRVGKEPIEGIMSPYGEILLSNNKRELRNFDKFNMLCSTENSYFRH